jgi:nucleoside-diphosphate-sugar epimerase
MGAVTEGRVAIFGAGGPLAAAAAGALRDQYTLRLTDLRPIAEIAAEGKPQSPGAPLPEVLPSPHECRVVDVTEYEQVLEAARGMDALVNCTVVRPHLAAAFGVNLIGAYNVARAAVELGINRIVQTGPQLVISWPGVDYSDDFGVTDDAPPRPGSNLYAVTKYLGGEVMRVFAARHGLEVTEFVYCGFQPAHGPQDTPGSGVIPFTVSWEDAGEAFLHALRAPSERFERPVECLHIVAPLPHGKFGTSGKTRRLLGWSPRHDFRHLWTGDSSATRPPG